MNDTLMGAVIALIGAALGAFVPAVKDFFLFKSSKKKKRDEACSLLIVFLEEYSLRCANYVSDVYGALEKYREHDCEAFKGVKSPEFSIPEGVAWDSVALEDALFLRMLPAKLTLVKEKVSVGWIQGYQELDETWEREAEEMAHVALVAWSIAAKLRKDLKVKPADWHRPYWDFVDYLECINNERMKRAKNEGSV